MLLGKVGVPEIAVDRGHGFADLQSLPVIAHGLAVFLALVIDRPDVVEGIGVLRVRLRGLLIKALRNRKHCLLVISDAQFVQVNGVLRRLHDQLLVCLGRFGIFLPGHLQIGAALQIGQVGGRRSASRNNVLRLGFLLRHAYPRRSLPVSRITICRQYRLRKNRNKENYEDCDRHAIRFHGEPPLPSDPLFRYFLASKIPKTSAQTPYLFPPRGVGGLVPA